MSFRQKLFGAIEHIEDPPVLVYDLKGICECIERLRHLSTLSNGAPYFAVKANRSQCVLKEFARAGFGADVASSEEVLLAREAGFREFVCTQPAISISLFRAIESLNGTVFFDSIDNVSLAISIESNLARHGVRLSMPGEYAHFGFTADELRDLVGRFSWKPASLQCHAGEYESLIDIGRRLVLIECWVRELGSSVVNFGGGYGVLSNDLRILSLAFEVFGDFARRCKVRCVFEFGRVAVARFGYLIARVVAKKLRGDVQIIVIDASAFNLGEWENRKVILNERQAQGDMVKTCVVGCTCYEGDLFCVGVPLPASLEVGEKIIFGLCGAYNSSIASTLHALSPPKEMFLN